MAVQLCPRCQLVTLLKAVQETTAALALAEQDGDTHLAMLRRARLNRIAAQLADALCQATWAAETLVDGEPAENQAAAHEGDDMSGWEERRDEIRTAKVAAQNKAALEAIEQAERESQE